MTLFGTLIGLHGSGGMHLETSDFGFTQPSDPQMALVSFRRLSLLLHMGAKRRGFNHFDGFFLCAPRRREATKRRAITLEGVKPQG